MRATGKTCKRIYKKFRLLSSDTVVGSFDVGDAGAAAVGGKTAEARELERLSIRKVWYQWPRRQYLLLSTFMDEFLGISTSVYRARYEAGKSRTERGAYGGVLHTLIKYMETPWAHGAGPMEARGGSSTRRRSFRRRWPGGGRQRIGFEDTTALTSESQTLELTAMEPADHLQSGGTISPPDTSELTPYEASAASSRAHSHR